jgi:hypothetical protein
MYVYFLQFYIICEIIMIYGFGGLYIWYNFIELISL